MKKILYVIGSMNLGGAESQAVLLIQNVMKIGWECELFVLQADGPLRQAFEGSAIKIHDGGYRATSSKQLKVLQLLRALFRVWNVARKTKPDVLHAYLPLTNFFGALAGFIAKVPKVITSRRALGTHQDRHKIMKFLDPISNALSTHVTVNSHAVGDDTIVRDKINPQKLIHISNGLDIAPFEKALEQRETMRTSFGLKKDDIGIVNVANLIAYKGHQDLILAASNIIKRNPHIFLYLVGEDRGIGQDLIKQIQDLGVSNQVRFMGCRKDVPEVLAAMNIFVLPSHEEGSSNALLEAMATKLSIIATDVGGNRETLDQGRLGILVPPRDVRMLEKALESLIESIHKNPKSGEFLQSHIRKNYNVMKMVQSHVNLYQSKK